MKANKITLKRIRIEYLESIVGVLERVIEDNRYELKRAKKDLEEAEIREDDLQYYSNRVDDFEIRVQVGESLMAELEKMV